MQTKVQAYTILEVTIAMLITAVLVAITYTAYTIVSQSYLSFNKKHNEMGIVLQLDKLLKRDFTMARLISKTENGILLKKDGGIVTYDFLPDMTIRTQGITDTFKVKTNSLITSFENQPVEAMNADTTENKLDDLSLELILQNEKIPYHYHKSYSSADLFQQQPDAIH